MKKRMLPDWDMRRSVSHYARMHSEQGGVKLLIELQCQLDDGTNLWEDTTGENRDVESGET